MTMEKITIRAFRAVEDPDRCALFGMEHARVLTDLGVNMVVKPDDSWAKDPNTFVFVAEHTELGMVAGIRLEIATAHLPLRMQNCLEPMCPNIVPILQDLQPHGNAELCGLWNAHRFSGQGIPSLLIEAAIGASSQLGLRTIVTFIAEYVAPYAERSGFVPLQSIGAEGILVYPIPSIKTWAMVLPDVLTICNAKFERRKRLLSLRIRPKQERIETPKKSPLLVTYELLLDPTMTDGFEFVFQQHRRFAA